MTKISDFYIHTKPQDGEVGIEIETEGSFCPEINVNGWKTEDDGSLRGYENAEYVLKKPVYRDAVRGALLKLSKMWKHHGAIFSPDCPRTGVHVHINCQEMSFTQLVNFYCLYIILEDLLIKYCGPLREGNLFCLRTRDAEYTIKRLLDVINSGDWKLLTLEDIRYSSANLCALPKYGSLEFRALRGTTDVNEIQTWILILLKLKDASLKFEKARNIISTFSQEGGGAFLYNILGEYSELVECYNMDKLIRSGVRRIQQVAHTFVKEPVNKREIAHKALKGLNNPIFLDEDMDMGQDIENVINKINLQHRNGEI